MKNIVKIAGASALALMGNNSAQATVITYQVAGTFVNGQTFSGGFSVDDQHSSAESITDIDIKLGTLALPNLFSAGYYGNDNGTDQFFLGFGNLLANGQPFIQIQFIANHTGFFLNTIADQDLSLDSLGYDGLRPAYLQSGAITNSANAAVPEPATWAMFIGGFGLIGAGMRRRQRVAVRFA